MTNAILLAQTVSILLLGLLVVGLLKSHGRLLKVLHDAGFDVGTREQDPHGGRIEAPARTGKAAVDVAGTTPAGSAVSINLTDAGHPTLLAFLSTGCASCQTFWAGMSQAEKDLPGSATRLVVLTKGPEAESPGRIIELAPPSVKLVQSTQAWEAYEVPVTPYFVLVDGGTGRVAGEGSATSWAQVNSLLGQALADISVDRSRPVRFGRRGEETADQALGAAGIGPEHPSLRPPGAP